MADYEDTNVSNLIINNISQEKFDELKNAGQLDPTQVYLTPEQGGGASLPDQTGNAGKFLMTDGATPSWGNAWSYGTIPEDTICIGSLTDTNAAGAVVISRQATSAGTYTVNIGGGNSLGPASVAIGYQAVVDLNKGKSIAIGAGARCMAKNAIQLAAVGGSYSITQTTNSDDNTFKVANNNGNFEMMDANGNVPRERLKNLVEVLPTADNGYTTVKNFGNGYVEITGYTAIGTVGAGTGSEVQIDLPAGYTMADANYWVNIAPTSETTMFDFKAEAKARSTTHFMVAYKNEDTVTGLTAAGVYWEVRGMLATA